MRHVKKRPDSNLDFEVYHFVFEMAMEIFEELFEISRYFPKGKWYLTDQIRVNSEMVCASLTEAWRMRDTKSVLMNKLSDAALAASRTQNCLALALRNNYIRRETFHKIDTKYEDIFDMICTGTRKKTDFHEPLLRTYRQAEPEKSITAFVSASFL
jgi:four helix bundle protein